MPVSAMSCVQRWATHPRRALGGRTAALTEVNRQLRHEWILPARVHADNWPSAQEEPMMRFDGVLISIVTCVMASMAAPAVAQQKVDLGKREFEGKCAVCHGKDGKGGGPYGEHLKRSLPDLSTMARRNGGVFPVNRTYEVIEGAAAGHGTREMPVWGLDYTVQATEQLPDLPYNQTLYVRTRIMALLEYLTQLQVK
ncbi:MAG: c-type cytochrome [Rubrivivax sp.]